MVAHGEDENPMHSKKEPLDLSFDPVERLGLTTEQVETKLAEFGYNELPIVTISAWWVFFPSIHWNNALYA